LLYYLHRCILPGFFYVGHKELRNLLIRKETVQVDFFNPGRACGLSSEVEDLF
jgi:hypothetical protein